VVSQVARKREQVRKAHSLIGQAYDPRNLTRAWERVRENRGAGGVDRVSIDRFERDHQRYLTVLHQRLGNGSYRPQPVRRVEIEKPGTTAKRPLRKKARAIEAIMTTVPSQTMVSIGSV